MNNSQISIINIAGCNDIYLDVQFGASMKHFSYPRVKQLVIADVITSAFRKVIPIDPNKNEIGIRPGFYRAYYLRQRICLKSTRDVESQLIEALDIVERILSEAGFSIEHMTDVMLHSSIKAACRRGDGYTQLDVNMLNEINSTIRRESLLSTDLIFDVKVTDILEYFKAVFNTCNCRVTVCMDTSRLGIEGVKQIIEDNLFNKLNSSNKYLVYRPENYDVQSVSRRSMYLNVAVGECPVSTQARFTMLRGCNHPINELGDALRVYIADMMLNRSAYTLHGNIAVDIWQIDSYTLVQRISWTGYRFEDYTADIVRGLRTVDFDYCRIAKCETVETINRLVETLLPTATLGKSLSSFGMDILVSLANNYPQAKDINAGLEIDISDVLDGLVAIAKSNMVGHEIAGLSNWQDQKFALKGYYGLANEYADDLLR